ncbi:hypothetical protein EHF36_07050 [Kerstersia gyiorum]|uniref:hypothetical protein n=1 Tax=Kerstersia gyiorum TaxID=206506 RepID=UPI0010714B02|nr:hypothetical protein [Kerstersia gyiorum]QBR40414.1 hypothetical protein EHF36_07050 [Kerstersia gyiorum]
MSVLSKQTGTCLRGVILETTKDGLRFRIYVVIGEADLDAVTEILPAEVFEESGEVHVCGLDMPEQAPEQLSDVLDNMNDGDVAVIFCASPAVQQSVLYSLRLPGIALPSHLN